MSPTTTTNVTIPAALIGDRARAAMLLTLAAGEEFSASDLAHVAGISPATASIHLAQLRRAGLVSVRRTGRHAFYRLSNPAVVTALEALAAIGPRDRRPSHHLGPAADPERLARTCYDHLAGKLGVGLTEALIRARRISTRPDGYGLTKPGRAFLEELGIDPRELRARPRAFARPCLDRTERRPHVGGALGAALAERCFARGWIQAEGPGRKLRVTPAGKTAFRNFFGLEV